MIASRASKLVALALLTGLAASPAWSQGGAPLPYRARLTVVAGVRVSVLGVIGHGRAIYNCFERSVAASR